MTSVMENFDEFIHHRHHGDQDAAAEMEVARQHLIQGAHQMAALFEQEHTMTTPAEPSVFASTAAVLHDLDGNLLVSKLYEGGLGKRLTPKQVESVLVIVSGIENAHEGEALEPAT